MSPMWMSASRESSFKLEAREGYPFSGRSLLAKSLSRNTKGCEPCASALNEPGLGEFENGNLKYTKKKLSNSGSQKRYYQSSSPYGGNNENSNHCLKNWVSPIKKFIPVKIKSKLQKPRMLFRNKSGYHTQDKAESTFSSPLQGLEQNKMIKCLKNDLKKFITHSRERKCGTSILQKPKTEKPEEIQKASKPKPRTITITESKEEGRFKAAQPKIMLKPVLSTLFRNELNTDLKLTRNLVEIKTRNGHQTSVASNCEGDLARRNLERIALHKFGSYTPN